MKKKYRVLKKHAIICLAIAAGYCLFQSSPANAYDWEIWPENTIKVKIHKRAALNFSQEFRIRDDMSKFREYHMHAGASFRLTDYFETAAWYKFVEQNTRSAWKANHVLVLDGTLKGRWKFLRLSNRSRFEYNGTKGSWLYRDRIKIEYPISQLKPKISPYISNDLYLSIHSVDSGFRENRAQIGLTVDLIMNTQWTIYYMCRSVKRGDNWNNANVLGTAFGINL